MEEADNWGHILHRHLRLLSCVGALLRNRTPFFQQLAPANFSSSSQTNTSHFSQLVICFLTPPCSKSERWELTFPLLSHPLRLLEQKKRERKRKTTTQHTGTYTRHTRHVRRPAWKSRISVAGCNMFLSNMLMCESARSQASKITR